MSGRDSDQVKRACSVKAALGWGPSAVAGGDAEGAFFRASVSGAGANCFPPDLRFDKVELGLAQFRQRQPA